VHDPWRPVAPSGARAPSTGVGWEYRTVRIPREVSRSGARQLLSELAERGEWTLDRLRRYPDGRRVVLLRRRAIRVARTA